MKLGDRLRGLDERVMGPRSTDAQPRPTWVRFGALAPGMWFLLVYDAVTGAGPGWTIAAIVYGVLAVPACIASALWQRRHGTGRLDRHALWAVGLLFILGATIVTAGAVARRSPDGLAESSYPLGCHRAPRALFDRLSRNIHGDYRLNAVVTYGSPHAAVAAALVSGSMRIGGANFPIDREVADWQVRPGPLAAANPLADAISPDRQRGVVGAPFGTGDDEVQRDRMGAESCVTSPRG